MQKFFKRSLYSIVALLVLVQSSFALNQVELSVEYIANPAIGKALSLADIYVGVVDLDPKVVGNQKQISVLQENGTTVNVAQPISTSAGGVPLYNGSPVTILVDGSYSLRIDDSSGSQVYYVPKNAELESINSFDSIADMRAITETPADGDVFTLLGHDAATENRDWTFQWSAASTATDDDATIVKATAITTGRWIRLFSGDIHTSWWGTDLTVSLPAAEAYWGSTKGGILIDRGTYDLASNSYTINDNITLRIDPGTLISNATITFYGAFDVGRYRVFDTDVTITFNYGEVVVYPQWWGAIGNNFVDCYPSIQKALDSVIVGGEVSLGTGKYLISQSLQMKYSGSFLSGAGRRATYIYIDSLNANAVLMGWVTAITYDMKIEGIRIDRPNIPTGGVGIALNNTRSARVLSVDVYNATIGVDLVDSPNAYLYDVRGQAPDNTLVYKGIAIDGDNPSVSTFIFKCSIGNIFNEAAHFAGTEALIYGIYYTSTNPASGGLSDILIEDFNTSRLSYGIFIQGAAGGNTNNDILIRNPVLDFASRVGLYIANIEGDGSITVNGGWCNPLPNKPLAAVRLIQLENVNGLQLTGGFQTWANKDNVYYHYGLYINDCTNINVLGNYFNSCYRGVWVTGTSTKISVANNMFKNAVLHGGNETAVYLDAAVSRSRIESNTVDGFWFIGLQTAVGSSHTMFVNNIVDPLNITNPIILGGGVGSVETPNISI